MPEIDLSESYVGSQLRALRQAHGLSLGALSRLSGVHDSTLSRWESGKRQPLIPELEMVLDALGVDRTSRRDLLRKLDTPRALVHLRRMDAAAASPVGGDLLQVLRLRKGWTQAEAARAIGVNQSQVARWENGEAWPSAEKLHALCWHLGAEGDETVELTAMGAGGSFRSGSMMDIEEPDLPPEGKILPREVVMPWIKYVDRHLFVHPEPYVLNLLRLQNRLSLLASRHPFAEQLLPSAYAIRARHHLQRMEMRQAAAAAQQGIALARRLRHAVTNTPSLWFGSVIVLAAVAAKTGSLAGLRRAIHLLTEWLPAIEGCPPHHAWGCADLASYLARLGHAEEAITLSARACRQAAHALPGDYQYRLHDHAHVLGQVGHPREALRTLDTTRSISKGIQNFSPYFSLRQELLEAQCLLSLQDRGGADERLRAAEKIVENNHLTPGHTIYVTATAQIQKAANN